MCGGLVVPCACVLGHTSLFDAVLIQLGLTLVGQGRTVLHMRCDICQRARAQGFQLHDRGVTGLVGIAAGPWVEHLAQSG